MKLARCAGDLGAVPRTLGALRELKVLHIVGTSPVEKLQLVGQLPPELGDLAKLEELRVSYSSIAVPNSNLQPDFNVSVRDSFDEISSAVLRELDESNRFVQKSAESISI